MNLDKISNAKNQMSNQCQMIKYQIYFLKFELWISFELRALTFDIKHILLLTNI